MCPTVFGTTCATPPGSPHPEVAPTIVRPNWPTPPGNAYPDVPHRLRDHCANNSAGDTYPDVPHRLRAILGPHNKNYQERPLVPIPKYLYGIAAVAW